MRLPIRKVEKITPMLARLLITHFCLASSFTFTCRAPANSKKLNIPCIRVLSKSMLETMSSAFCSNSINPKLLKTIRISEHIIAITKTPIVVGSFMNL